MAVLTSAFQISKTFGAHKLFTKISFAIEENQRIALTGPNGAGKSTLLKILAGINNYAPDSGQVTHSQSLRLGYLEQSHAFSPNETLYDALINVTSDPDDPTQISFVWELISKFHFEEANIFSDTLVKTLSGGWQKKVAIAREMAKRPNLLLLDEPTNHLDVESIMWLEEWLERENNLACLIVTHDRLFLQNTCDNIFDLDSKNPEGIIKYEGTYADFLAVKDSLLSAQAQLEESQRNVLRRETAWLRRGAKARQTKQKARIERAFELADEVKYLADKRRERLSKFDFGALGRSPKVLISAEGITKKYNEKVLFKNFNFKLFAKARIGLLGPNGCGKSTLIRSLVGQLPIDEGVLKITEGVKYSYFDQRKETLELDKTVLRNLCPEGDYVHLQGQPIYARSYLSRFHFRPEQMDMPASRLSGGEQSRLILIRMMLQAEQVLILDEPTNDLDIETLDTFQEALEEFPGAIILVTHDRYFLDQVATEILAFSGNGEIEKFADFFQWEEWHKTQSNSAKKKDSAKAQNASTSPVKTNAIKLSYKERLELESMEIKIMKEEEALSALQSQLQDPMILASHDKLSAVSQSINSQQHKVETLYARWQELSGRDGDTK